MWVNMGGGLTGVGGRRLNMWRVFNMGRGSAGGGDDG